VDERVKILNRWIASVDAAIGQLSWFAWYCGEWKASNCSDAEFMRVVKAMSEHGLESWLDANENGVDDLRALVTGVQNG